MDTAGAQAMSAMEGLPPAIYYTALAMAALLTVWSVLQGPRWFGQPSGGWRLDLLAWRPLHWVVSRRPFQFALQVPLVLALFLILSAGFLGSPVADRNIATVLTWTIWWTLLILDIVLLGRMWCLVCPWEALASWLRRLTFWRRRRDEPLALDLKWPRWLRNVYPATVLFVGLTWLELGFGVTRSPRATAILGLVMVLLAVVPALIFERRSFCRYGCLIGRICGLYSMMAPVEVRARDQDVCRVCRTKECLTGSDRGYPCPTGQSPGALRANTYCTVCTECVKSCPSDNVAINLRPWATDLHAVRQPRRDEAVLAVVMISLTTFHGLTMTPVWTTALAWLRATSGLRYLTAFTLGMAVVVLVPSALYLSFSAMTRRALPVAGSRSTVWQVAIRYAYPLIAIALMYHLAHNAGHFLIEAGRLVPVLSDPFGTGRDLFNTAGLEPGPLVSRGTIWLLQIVLVLLGLYWGLRTTERAHRGLSRRWMLPDVGWRTRLVTSGFLLMLTIVNLWLLAQPMEMRTWL
ncbi:MAG: hypothetical protein QF681_11780 [Vicinamibacterales bacterium]|jgi:hypothetical protein|nr:hypothetical protein [Vicinamibacterales bacterium]